MNWIRTNWTLFSIIVLATGLGWMIFFPPPAEGVTGGRIPAPNEGFLTPDFTLRDSRDQSVQLSALRGQVVLVNVWASWCAPCKAEMPAMQEVYEAYVDQGFTILAVNTTFQDDRSRADAFAESLGLTFPILYDLDGTVSFDYQVRAMPTSFFVDRQGVIRRVVMGGPMSEALLRAEIEKLLEEGE